MESESSRKNCKIPSSQTLCSFLVLALIRGSFAVLIHYGIDAYKTPSLLFLLRTPGTLVLFFISVLYLASKDEDTKLEIVNNLKSSRLYKRAALLGFFQLCGPYMLFMYAMKYLSPTLGAVFMCSTPWSTMLLEQFLAITVQRTGGKQWNAIGPIIGTVGIIAVSVSNICLITMDTSCEAIYEYKNVTRNIGNRSYIENITSEKIQLRPDVCFTSLEITTAFLALCGATCLWSISAVFSKLKHVSLHFLVGGLLNNAFGGLYAGILWLIVEQHINTSNVVWDSFFGSVSVIFLSVASSWVASLILYYLYKKIGAKLTNRVMCLVPFIAWLEDLLFLHHLRHTFTWIGVFEVFGLVLVVIALYVSSIQQEKTTLEGAQQLLPTDDSSEEEDDGFIQRQAGDLTDTVQSEEELMQSGTSSMQDSVEPPILHYADDENDDVGEVY